MSRPSSARAHMVFEIDLGDGGPSTVAEGLGAEGLGGERLPLTTPTDLSVGMPTERERLHSIDDGSPDRLASNGIQDAEGLSGERVERDEVERLVSSSSLASPRAMGTGSNGSKGALGASGTEGLGRKPSAPLRKIDSIRRIESSFKKAAGSTSSTLTRTMSRAGSSFLQTAQSIRPRRGSDHGVLRPQGPKKSNEFLEKLKAKRSSVDSSNIWKWADWRHEMGREVMFDSSDDEGEDATTSFSAGEQRTPSSATSPSHLKARVPGMDLEKMGTEAANRAVQMIEKHRWHQISGQVFDPTLVQPYERDMEMSDLKELTLPQFQHHTDIKDFAAHDRLRPATLIEEGPFGENIPVYWQDTTKTHEICMADNLEALTSRLQKEKDEGSRKDFDAMKMEAESFWDRKADYNKKERPQKEIYQPNRVGQLPIHVCAYNRRVFREQDGDMREMEDISQPAPEMATLLLTGRNPKNGEVLFNVQRDEAGLDISCLHQDSLGMTPLHLACISASSRAHDVVIRLLEANPHAAKIYDTDGLLPLDWACRSPHRGASDIVKLLLKANPEAAIVQNETSKTANDWREMFQEVDPVASEQEEKEMPLLHDTLVDKMLHFFPDGASSRTKDLRFVMPQRVLVQQMLIEIDTWYHEGNISSPNYLAEISKEDLRERLRNDHTFEKAVSKGVLGVIRKRKISEWAKDLAKDLPTRLPSGGAGKTFSRAEQIVKQTKEAAKERRQSTEGLEESPIAPMAISKEKKSLFSFAAVAQSTKKLPAAGKKRQQFQSPFKEMAEAILKAMLSHEEYDHLISRFFDCFNLFNGCASTREVSAALLQCTFPIQKAEVNQLLQSVVMTEERQQTVKFEDFRTVLLHMLRRPVVIASQALKNRWTWSPDYSKTVNSNIYINKETHIKVNANNLAKAIKHTTIMDPAAVISRAPYKATEEFLRDDKRIGKSTNLSVYGEPIVDLTMRDMYKRLDSMHDAVDQFRRLPLHFACSNWMNEEAAIIVRDVLSAYKKAAAIQDKAGCIPLHLACRNPSSSNLNMVRLLIDEYPEGAAVENAAGDLPLHDCLRENSGDACFEIVCLLLEAYPESASIPSGRTKALARPYREYPAMMAIFNRSYKAAEITFMLLCAFPDILSWRDRSDSTLLHRFCWNHKAFMSRKAKQKQDKEDKKYRDKSQKEKEFLSRKGRPIREVRVLEAINLASKIFNPLMLQEADCNGALPLHYACQVPGTESRDIAVRLMEMHPQAVSTGDKYGNTPLHAVLGSSNEDCVKVLAKKSRIAFMIPNKSYQLPVSLPGAWKLRILFQMPSVFNTSIQLLQTICISPCIAIISVILAAMYYDHGDRWNAGSAVVPLLVFSSLAMIKDYSRKDKMADRSKIIQALGILINLLQLRIPLVGLLSAFGLAHERQVLRLLWIKRMEMPAVAFPLGVLHLYALMHMDKQGQSRDLQWIIVFLCWTVLSFSGMEQDSYRFFDDPQHPYMLVLEHVCTFFFRVTESFHRISNYSLILYATGVQGLYLGIGGEIIFTMILGNRLLTFLEDPASNFKFLRREMFDICGLYHGFGKLPSSFRMDGSADIVGRVNLWDALVKTIARTISQIVVLAVAALEMKNRDVMGSVQTTLVIFSAICVGLHVVLLGCRAFIHKIRQRHLVQKRDLFQMEAWSTRIFEKTSPEFIAAVNEYLITCRFSPGDYIIKQGEEEPVLHIITKGVAFRRKQGARDSAASRASSRRGTEIRLARSGSWLGKIIRQGTDNIMAHKEGGSPMHTTPRHDTIHRDSQNSGHISPSRRMTGQAYEDKNLFDYKSILLMIYRTLPEILEMCEEDVNVQLMPRGSTIGESGLMSHEPHAFDVVARSTVETQALSGEAFKMLLNKFPKMVHRIQLKSDEDESREDVEAGLSSVKSFIQSPSSTHKPMFGEIQLESQMMIPSIRRGLLFEKTRGKPQAALMLTLDLGKNGIHSEMDLCEDILQWDLHCLLQISGRAFSVESRKYPRFLVCFYSDDDQEPTADGFPAPQPEALAGQLFSIVNEQASKLNKFLLASKIVDIEKVATHGLVFRQRQPDPPTPKKLNNMELEGATVFAETGLVESTRG